MRGVTQMLEAGQGEQIVQIETQPDAVAEVERWVRWMVREYYLSLIHI